MLVAQIITFTNEEVTKVNQLHDDILILTLQIANHNIHWVLIDTESSVDVLFLLAYNQMELLPTVLKPTNTSLRVCWL